MKIPEIKPNLNVNVEISTSLNELKEFLKHYTAKNNFNYIILKIKLLINDYELNQLNIKRDTEYFKHKVKEINDLIDDFCSERKNMRYIKKHWNHVCEFLSHWRDVEFWSLYYEGIPQFYEDINNIDNWRCIDDGSKLDLNRSIEFFKNYVPKPKYTWTFHFV